MSPYEMSLGYMTKSMRFKAIVLESIHLHILGKMETKYDFSVIKSVTYKWVAETHNSNSENW